MYIRERAKEGNFTGGLGAVCVGVGVVLDHKLCGKPLLVFKLSGGQRESWVKHPNQLEH